jgi:diaminohydroxyphosphoribosylaminopyrimidine deaminase/5-amino-6-(5-phosphoribosylamino)uracil reductase
VAQAIDEALMRQAIAMGRTALGLTRPNPPVGCVIARGERVFAAAATAPAGRPHAEEQALEIAGAAAMEAACYVTLEPCGARSSGAASCAERLAAAGIARVVIACEDVSPLASGQGIDRLRAAGVKVEVGVLAAEAAPLSAGFRQRLATGRPLVEAADGPATYEGRFEIAAGEDLAAALQRFGQEGYNRLWTPRRGDVAQRLAALGWLGAGTGAAMR